MIPHLSAVHLSNYILISLNEDLGNEVVDRQEFVAPSQMRRSCLYPSRYQIPSA